MKDLIPVLLVFVLPPLIVAIWQAILNRLVKGKSPQLLTMISMVLGYPLFFMIVVSLPFSVQMDVGFYLYMFLLYSFSAYTYFHFFNMSETSRRVRMIQAIARDGSADFDIDNLYNDREMISARLDRLVALNQIEERDGKYYPTSSRLFLMAATLFYGFGLLLDRPWPAVKKFVASHTKSK